MGGGVKWRGVAPVSNWCYFWSMEKFYSLKKVFEKFPAIKLVYLFGSRAVGEVGPLSDYDFAFYLDEADSTRRFELKLILISELAGELKTDAVDVVVLNDLEQPEFKYHIVSDGKLIYEEGSFKVIVEPRILNEYFDFRESLRRYGLTKA